MTYTCKIRTDAYSDLSLLKQKKMTRDYLWIHYFFFSSVCVYVCSSFCVQLKVVHWNEFVYTVLTNIHSIISRPTSRTSWQRTTTAVIDSLRFVLFGHITLLWIESSWYTIFCSLSLFFSSSFIYWFFPYSLSNHVCKYKVFVIKVTEQFKVIGSLFNIFFFSSRW